MLYRKETLILEEVTTTLLPIEIRKRSNQEEQEGSGLVVKGKKEREGKKSLGSSKVWHFCQQEGHWKKDCKHRQEWLKKNKQAVKADILMSCVDTEVLMASYIENNTYQGKGWILDYDSTIHVCS